MLAEHRKGCLREITYELLAKGMMVAKSRGLELSVILLGSGCSELAGELAYHADKVIVVNHPNLAEFNAEAYRKVLVSFIANRIPRLTLIGHTSCGLDLAPALAIELGIPLATDCIDLRLDGRSLIVTRQVYGGKLNIEGVLKEADNYVATIRPVTFKPGEPRTRPGEIISLEYPKDIKLGTRFIGFVEPPPGEVDITDAEVIVSVGRGIKEEKNISIAKKLAEALKGELGCSRPVVDKGWLPKERQVGSSGKTVKPKLYIASGISGSFQHMMGMKNSELIVAVNRDPKAPIFSIADYGVVDDLFMVLPALTKKISNLKGSE
ncbi:MAG: electron transfer flavoprotein subunit alpha/FixB family protein [Candidatus Bathyarchaeota archaeon]|nr:electron transfer flavoprotein subunit alpha/FixB family protein [Candidatus Bathyarchaeota archaeon]MDP7443393.1 electron transfer flavoprotein subunit alpha/FixB family protein [Candidatus Bathyarchaeota archaeon]